MLVFVWIYLWKNFKWNKDFKKINIEYVNLYKKKGLNFYFFYWVSKNKIIYDDSFYSMLESILKNVDKYDISLNVNENIRVNYELFNKIKSNSYQVIYYLLSIESNYSYDEKK